MLMDNRRIYQIILLVVLVIVAVLLWPKLKAPQQQQISVTDFGSCQSAGGQIMQTDPITCVYNGKTYTEAETQTPDMQLDKPAYGDLVTSPMTVSGKVRGNWFFEASMPAVLKDETGKVLFQGPIHTTGDWMTTDYVPFSQTITFDPGTAQYGVLIISKDNPSGDPANDSSYAVPVRFK